MCKGSLCKTSLVTPGPLAMQGGLACTMQMSGCRPPMVAHWVPPGPLAVLHSFQQQYCSCTAGGACSTGQHSPP
jgi:hypothetical protein